MKKLCFLVLVLGALAVPAALFSAEAVSSSTAATTTSVTVSSLDQTTLIAMIRPMLETYSAHHPDEQIRIWSTIIMAHLKDIDQDELLSVPALIQQMGSSDENIRAIALDTIEQLLNLDDKTLKAVMAPLLRTLAKTAKYPEVKKLAIQALGEVQGLSTESLNSLPMLFELAQDEDPDIRKTALDTITGMLSKGGGGGPGGG